MIQKQNLPEESIDRHALVQRHNPVIRKVDALSPLSIGNGTFACIKEKCIAIKAGQVERLLSITDTGLITSSLTVEDHPVFSGVASEFALRFSFADPNEEPRGISNQSAEGLSQSTTKDALNVEQLPKVDWVNPVRVDSETCFSLFEMGPLQVSDTLPGRKVLHIPLIGLEIAALAGVRIDLHYEVDSHYSAIRKWISIVNSSSNWIKVDDFILESIIPGDGYNHMTDLTPSERGAGTSVRAFSNEDRSAGLIAVSEIPSALRVIGNDGVMRYNDEYFEWVLGPDEQFLSEPVFHYAFSGKSYRTASAMSTALDRTVEGPYLRYLEEIVGVVADTDKLSVPLWCTWSNFGPLIDDASIREMADAASAAGFVGLQLDAGWSKSKNPEKWNCGDAEPSLLKFPDFDATCAYVRETRGLDLGLWISCYRSPESKDFEALPNACSLPLVHRDEGVGMSYAGPWREYFAHDVVKLSKRYGAVYFKQDLSNILYGDINDANDSRTKKESYLRALRGLLESQQIIHDQVPEINMQLTHEIYWGTPGVPCDVASIKYADTFHIPPNDYSGCGHWKKRAVDFDPEIVDKMTLRGELQQGCFNARNRFFVHRGLPLYCIEYYGAATVDWKGSLTPEIQDRQICSWLMGAPSVFAGDLATLSKKKIAHYRDRFDIVKDLQKRYDIYRHYQYSGVPAPTDTNWHWWGKLNEDGYGAVVIIRGNKGRNQRRINIPWVNPDTPYVVMRRLTREKLGVFKGKELTKGKLKLSLPEMGQEILELAEVTE